jgi:hypothetical protein
LPPKEAGQAVQQETQAARSAKGKQVGAAKEVLKKSLPTNVRSDTEYLQQALKDKGAEPDAGFVRNPYTDKEFGDLTPKQQSEVLQKAQDLKTSETGQIPVPKNGEAVQTAKAIKDELGEEKLGLRDPNSPPGKLTNKLISGKNPNEGIQLRRRRVRSQSTQPGDQIVWVWLAVRGLCNPGAPRVWHFAIGPGLRATLK